MINGLLFWPFGKTSYSFENSWVTHPSLVDWTLSYWVVPQKIMCKPGGWMALQKGFTIVPAGCDRLGMWWRKNISLCSKQKTPGYVLRKKWDFRSFLSTIKWEIMFCGLQKKKSFLFVLLFPPGVVGSWKPKWMQKAQWELWRNRHLSWVSDGSLSLSPSACYIPTARETSPLVASGNVNG